MTDNDKKPAAHQPPAQQPHPGQQPARAGQPGRPGQPVHQQPQPGAGQHGEHGAKESPLVTTGLLGEQHDQHHDQHHDSVAEDDRKRAEQQPVVKPMTTEQAVTPAAGPPQLGGRAMYVLVGPYRGSVLTMLDAEAENAKDNHWAVEMDTVAPPFDASNPAEHDHELTEEDRAYALEAANAWAAKVNQPPEPPPPEGRRRKGETEAQREHAKRNADRHAQHRDRQRPKAPHPGEHPGEHDNAMHPDHGGGDYATRDMPAAPKKK